MEINKSNSLTSTVLCPIDVRKLTKHEIAEIKSVVVIEDELGSHLMFFHKSGSVYGFPLDFGFTAKAGTVPNLSDIQLITYVANIYATPYNSNGQIMMYVRF